MRLGLHSWWLIIIVGCYATLALGIVSWRAASRGSDDFRDHLNYLRSTAVLASIPIAEITKNQSAFMSTLVRVPTVLQTRSSILPSIPTLIPVKGIVTSPFGARKSPFTGRRKMHFGVDIGTKRGATVRAAADGIVKFAGRISGYGNIAVIEHDLQMVTKYAHNSSLLVKKGQRILKGQPIATAGTSGRTTGPHLHYEVWIDGAAVDPMTQWGTKLADKFITIERHLHE
jgi:murein DD-endopeptidase MepM/ murein hydrolase activator NlpD